MGVREPCTIGRCPTGLVHCWPNQSWFQHEQTLLRNMTPRPPPHKAWTGLYTTISVLPVLPPSSAPSLENQNRRNACDTREHGLCIDRKHSVLRHTISRGTAASRSIDVFTVACILFFTARVYSAPKSPQAPQSRNFSLPHRTTVFS